MKKPTAVTCFACFVNHNISWAHVFYSQAPLVPGPLCTAPVLRRIQLEPGSHIMELHACFLLTNDNAQSHCHRHVQWECTRRHPCSSSPDVPPISTIPNPSRQLTKGLPRKYYWPVTFANFYQKCEYDCFSVLSKLSFVFSRDNCNSVHSSCNNECFKKKAARLGFNTTSSDANGRLTWHRYIQICYSILDSKVICGSVGRASGRARG